MIDMKIWDEYAKTGSLEIRNMIVEDNLKLVNYIVKRLMIRKPEGIMREDLVQFGILGLMEAIDKYDPSYDTSASAKFETFAARRISGKILDEIRKYNASNGGPTRTVLTKIKKVKTVIHELESKLQRHPTIEEVAEAMEMNLDEYYKLLGHISVVMPMSLDKMVGVDENLSAFEVISDEKSPQPEKDYMYKERVEFLIKEIDLLPEKEHRVIVAKYYEDLTLREISYILGVKQSRVSQLHTNALLLLRTRLDGRF